MPIDKDIQPPQFRDLLSMMTKLEGKRPGLEEVRLALLQIVDTLTKKGDIARFLFPSFGLGSLYKKGPNTVRSFYSTCGLSPQHDQLRTVSCHAPLTFAQL